MGKPIKTTYKSEDPRVATFRITHGQWEKFQEICKGQNRSASDAIVSFIDSVIAGDSIPESKGDFPDIEAIVRDQVSAAIANLTGQLTDIAGEVEDLKKLDAIA
jgi:hypothetical protein